MALSIIIPVGYDPDGLEITLSSIFKSSEYTGITIDVIVINDGYDLEVEKINIGSQEYEKQGKLRTISTIQITLLKPNKTFS